MIKEGQVYQLKENEKNRIVVKGSLTAGFWEVITRNRVLDYISEYALKHYNLIAEYRTFEEAVSSPEFTEV